MMLYARAELSSLFSFSFTKNTIMWRNKKKSMLYWKSYLVVQFTYRSNCLYSAKFQLWIEDFFDKEKNLISLVCFHWRLNLFSNHIFILRARFKFRSGKNRWSWNNSWKYLHFIEIRWGILTIDFFCCGYENLLNQCFKM